MEDKQIKFSLCSTFCSFFSNQSTTTIFLQKNYKNTKKNTKKFITIDSRDKIKKSRENRSNHVKKILTIDNATPWKIFQNIFSKLLKFIKIILIHIKTALVLG